MEHSGSTHLLASPNSLAVNTHISVLRLTLCHWVDDRKVNRCQQDTELTRESLILLFSSWIKEKAVQIHLKKILGVFSHGSVSFCFVQGLSGRQKGKKNKGTETGHPPVVVCGPAIWTPCGCKVRVLSISLGVCFQDLSSWKNFLTLKAIFPNNLRSKNACLNV
jgi:hypothetical protein